MTALDTGEFPSMKSMTPRERLLTAIDLGVPDRVPASVHQWQPYHLTKYMNGLSELEAFRYCGLDASLGVFAAKPVEDPNWKVEVVNLPAPEGETNVQRIITTPEGQLEYTISSNEITGFMTTHPVKRKEDIYLIDKYMPTPPLDAAEYKRRADEMGDDGIVRTCVWGEQGGPWQDAVSLHGTTEMIMAAADDPDWVFAFLDILWNKKEKWMKENLPGLPVDLVETGGGAASSTVISPRYYRKFCTPYDVKMHDLLHEMGFRVVYHTCGGMMPILEMIVENHCDAAETLTPPSMGGDARPQELKERIGDKVSLIGGVDQSNVLEVGTREQIFAHVRELFETYGKNGGYVMSPSDHFFHVPLENMLIYAEAARECVYG